MASCILNVCFFSETHIISAIINIAQDLDEPFSLDIFDHDKKPHKVLMEPGDIVWYESARYTPKKNVI